MSDILLQAVTAVGMALGVSLVVILSLFAFVLIATIITMLVYDIGEFLVQLIQKYFDDKGM